nr:unnamed protein product [Callosobruchus chinensis]
MQPRDFFISPQGGRSSYIKNRAVQPHLWPGKVLLESASVGLFKSHVNKISLI